MANARFLEATGQGTQLMTNVHWAVNLIWQWVWALNSLDRFPPFHRGLDTGVQCTVHVRPFQISTIHIWIQLTWNSLYIYYTTIYMYELYECGCCVWCTVWCVNIEWYHTRVFLRVLSMHMCMQYAVCIQRNTYLYHTSTWYLYSECVRSWIPSDAGHGTYYICSVNCIQPPTPFQLQELWILSCVKMCRLPTHVFLSYITYTS